MKRKKAYMIIVKDPNKALQLRKETSAFVFNFKYKIDESILQKTLALFLLNGIQHDIKNVADDSFNF